MHATKKLRAEHDAIADVLKILSILSTKARAGVDYDRSQAKRIIEFLRVFADNCHHGKEEAVLFPELEKAGLTGNGGPVRAMLREHASGRGHIDAMAKALAKGKSKAFARAAEESIELLVDHIRKEDDTLYRVADKGLPDAKQAEIIDRFETFERERIGPGVQESFRRLANELHRHYMGAQA